MHERAEAVGGGAVGDDEEDDEDLIGHTAHIGAVIEEVARLMSIITPDTVVAEVGRCSLKRVYTHGIRRPWRVWLNAGV